MFNLDAVSQYHEQYEFVAYAVQDTESRSYSVPSFWRSAVDAVRNFESGIFSQFAVKNGLFFSHPDDYRFCAIGGYNASDGVLEALDPIVVSNGYTVCLDLDLEHPCIHKED